MEHPNWRRFERGVFFGMRLLLTGPVTPNVRSWQNADMSPNGDVSHEGDSFDHKADIGNDRFQMEADMPRHTARIERTIIALLQRTSTLYWKPMAGPWDRRHSTGRPSWSKAQRSMTMRGAPSCNPRVFAIVLF